MAAATAAGAAKPQVKPRAKAKPRARAEPIDRAKAEFKARAEPEKPLVLDQEKIKSPSTLTLFQQAKPVAKAEPRAKAELEAAAEPKAKDKPGRPAEPDLEKDPQAAGQVSAVHQQPTQASGSGGVAAALIEQALGSWHFDAFALSAVTQNRPLSSLAERLFSRFGLCESLGLDRAKLSHLLLHVEDGYADRNAYHNRAHAASVLHSMHALLEHGGLLAAVSPALGGGRGSTLVRTACLFAAIIHDYEHSGVTNSFLVKTSHALAVRYNDQHVNEHHHAAAAFEALLQPENNFLAHLPASDFQWFRSLVIDLVLATDMDDNSRILQSFLEQLRGPPQGQLRTPSHGADSIGASQISSDFIPKSQAAVRLMLQVAIKCADLGHLAQPWDLHVRWVECLQEEFFAQGDREKEVGLPISFLMDRNKAGVMKSQTGFLDNIALPLFEALVQALPRGQPLLVAVAANRLQWQRCI